MKILGYPVTVVDMHMPNAEPVTFTDWRQWAGWQTTPPTEPGIYWAVSKSKVVVIVELTPSGAGKFWVSEILDEAERPVSQYTHWLGPLPVPDPPKE